MRIHTQRLAGFNLYGGFKISYSKGEFTIYYDAEYKLSVSNFKIRLCRKSKLVSFNHEGHEGPEEGVSIYSSYICELRDLRGEIITGRKLLEL